MSNLKYTVLIIIMFILCIGTGFVVGTTILQKDKIEFVFFEPQEKNIKIKGLKFKDDFNKTIQLSDFKEEYLILNLWATWCPPCVAELPSLDKLQKLRPNIKIIALSLDTKGKADIGKFYQKLNIKNLGIYTDDFKQARKSLPIKGLPVTFLINSDRKVIASASGAVEWDQAEALKELDILMK